jgi:hypothetical protein
MKSMLHGMDHKMIQKRDLNLFILLQFEGNH